MVCTMSASKTPAPSSAELTAIAWKTLRNDLKNYPLVLDDHLSIPEGVHTDFVRHMYEAYSPGIIFRLGSKPDFDIRTVQARSAAQEVLWYYYQHDFRYAIRARIQALAQTNQITPSQPTKNQAPRFADPAKYNGKQSKYREFTTQLQLEFTTNKERCNSKDDKIDYAASYLDRTATLLFHPQIDIATGTFKHTTFADLYKDLKEAFDDSDARRTAEQKLMELKQNTKDSTSYYTTFTTYTTLLNLDYQTKISFFKSRLN